MTNYPFHNSGCGAQSAINSRTALSGQASARPFIKNRTQTSYIKTPQPQTKDTQDIDVQASQIAAMRTHTPRVQSLQIAAPRTKNLRTQITQSQTSHTQTPRTQISSRGKKAGFTLAELVVVLALFALIGGMVSTFLVFMNAYSAKNAKASRMVSELTQIRAETDRWFSFADESGNEILFAAQAEGGGASAFTAETLPGMGESVTVARCGEMTVTLTGTEKGCDVLYFYGADNAKNQTLSMENAYGLLFYTQSSPYTSSPAAKIRFTAQLRVQGKIYACEVIA